MPETALVVTVPEAEPLVGAWRAKHDWSAQRGVPAHVTVLYPFFPTDRVDESLVKELRSFFALQAPFAFGLTRVARFPDVAWLAPEPSAPFNALTRLIAERYPEFPPYEGIHDEVIPHLTVAEGGPELQDQVEAALKDRLPFGAEARDVVWLFEGDDGLWREAHRFPLEG
jgi:2'-5' RNA ligase superfamily